MEAGQHRGPADDAVEAFVARVRALTDDERRAVAAARAEVDEAFHEKALRAAAEAVVGRSDVYARARAEVAGAHVPDGLGSEPGARWAEVARLTQLAIDEGLVALVARGTLHPNHLRELLRPWPVREGVPGRSLPGR